jgi:hypothetical protein
MSSCLAILLNKRKVKKKENVYHGIKVNLSVGSHNGGLNFVLMGILYLVEVNTLYVNRF